MTDKNVLPRTVPVGKAPLHPWYKERLLIKYGKHTSNKQHPSGNLDARAWRFLKPGLDDFRDGYPPPVGDQNFTRIEKVISPACGRDTKAGKRLTKEQICFSKQNPQRQARRGHVAEVEYSLTQHPLALYPHLQECISPELFDQVVSILDPEMSMTSEAASFPTNMHKEHAYDYAEQSKRNTQDAPKPNGEINTMQSAMQNPYLHLRVKENSSKDDQLINGKQMQSPSLDEEINKVTKHLHDWVVSLDGESEDPTETTLFNLLASAFERTPSLVFPIRIVDPHNLPEELRNSVEDLHKATTPDTIRKAPESPKSHSGKAKVNYGAQSLGSKTWKTRNTDIPVQDPPTVTKDQEFSVIPSKLDEELKQSYTAQAFRKFIVNKGLREPEFICSLFSNEEQEQRRILSETDAFGSAFSSRGKLLL
ncbi:hypothetical protein AAFF_G00425740 [Aldrovandia affinis]|uniref:Uncharacterized protein n=1 Tax=Aldrovandia affinis TaxID=143900 RepID=A0AAD7T712_9TELE|nr:hypothetical protein AAFF_G00425740 [Aldrovandia affinis]